MARKKQPDTTVGTIRIELSEPELKAILLDYILFKARIPMQKDVPSNERAPWLIFHRPGVTEEYKQRVQSGPDALGLTVVWDGDKGIVSLPKDPKTLKQTADITLADAAFLTKRENSRSVRLG